jgi:hypothetical protein
MSEDESNTPLLEPRSNKINHIQRTKWTPLEVVITLYFIAVVFSTVFEELEVSMICIHTLTLVIICLAAYMHEEKLSHSDHLISVPGALFSMVFM